MICIFVFFVLCCTTIITLLDKLQFIFRFFTNFENLPCFIAWNWWVAYICAGQQFSLCLTAVWYSHRLVVQPSSGIYSSRLVQSPSSVATVQQYSRRVVDISSFQCSRRLVLLPSRAATILSLTLSLNSSSIAAVQCSVSVTLIVFQLCSYCWV